MEGIEVAKEAAANAAAPGNDVLPIDGTALPNGDPLANGHAQPTFTAATVPALVPAATIPAVMPASSASLPADSAPAPLALDNLFDAESPIAPPAALPEIIIQEVTATVSGAAPEIPSEPTWKPHDIDLSRIGQRVLKYKYFAPQDFIDDIIKIVENAKNTNDSSLILKTEELLAQIKQHIDAFDPQWLPRFDRYRKRMLDRKAEAIKKREEAAVKGKETEGDSAAQETAEAAGTVNASGSVGEIANGLKRSREDEGGDGEKDPKRARDETMDVDIPDAHVHAPPSASLAAPTPGPSQVSLAGTEASFVTTDTTLPTVPPPRVPSPVPVYPPFVCPAGDIAKLGAELRVMTGDLNVDQLEQLRAGLYDLIWRSRSEWDRREVLVQAVQRVREFVEEVRELEDD